MASILHFKCNLLNENIYISIKNVADIRIKVSNQ